MEEISNDEFKELIKPDIIDLVSLSIGLKDQETSKIIRPLLGRLNMEAGKCEELFDSYGIKGNKYWYPLRISIASIKSFTQICYNLLHLKYAAPYYKLLDIKGDFQKETDKSLKVIIESFRPKLIKFCKFLDEVGLTEKINTLESYNFRSCTTDKVLVRDRKLKNSDKQEETACYLSTRFLILAEKSDILKIYQKTDNQDYIKCIPEVINEENMRNLANNFHNLQAKYDTYLYNTQIVKNDKSLPVLRGQISVVYHLLETMTILIHFCERHLGYIRNEILSDNDSKEISDYKKLLSIIFDYGITFSDRYIVEAQALCKNILRNYSEQGSIEVPIPNYRGFHVRPSTLISKIVHHYGSEVEMHLGDHKYNTAMPLELFRANEEINLAKRNMIAENILEHKIIKDNTDAVYKGGLMKKILRLVFLDLLEKKRIIMYENDFSFDSLNPYADESIADFCKRGIALYQALGKLDIITNITVTFTGDKRVLNDIKILAQNGYGEDKFGNNIVLPIELSYLRR